MRGRAQGDALRGGRAHGAAAEQLEAYHLPHHAGENHGGGGDGGYAADAAGDFQRNRVGDRFGRQREHHFALGAQPFGEIHAGNDAGDAAGQLRGDNRQPLAADFRPVDVKRHRQPHHGRLQPKIDDAAGFVISGVVDIEKLQVKNNQAGADHHGVAQNAAGAGAHEVGQPVNRYGQKQQRHRMREHFHHQYLRISSCALPVTNNTRKVLANVATVIESQSLRIRSK